MSSGRAAARISLHFPSARRWAARDGTQRAGRQGTVEAVDGPFMHVTSDHWDQVGMGRDPQGDNGATVKSSANAYPGSNPGPATASDLRNYTAVSRFAEGAFYQLSITFYPPTEPALLPGRRGPQSAWPGGVGSGEAGGCRFYWPTCRRRHGVVARRSRWRALWPPPSPRPANGAADADARRTRRPGRRPGTPGWHALVAVGVALGAQRQVQVDRP